MPYVPDYDYPPPRSIVALRALGPRLERFGRGTSVRSNVGQFLELAALRTETGEAHAADLRESYIAGRAEFEGALERINDTLGPTRLAAVMNSARDDTAAIFAQTASDLLGEAWQRLFNIAGFRNVAADMIGDYASLVARIVPFAQALWGAFEWGRTVRREQYLSRYRTVAHIYLENNADAFPAWVQWAIEDRLGVNDPIAQSQIFSGTLDYLKQYYQPSFDQMVEWAVGCEEDYQAEGPSWLPWEWEFGFGDSGCLESMLENVDDNAWIDSIARTLSAILSEELMPNPDMPGRGPEGPTREEAQAARDEERRRQGEAPNITNADIRDAVVDAITLRTHTGNMTIQPADLRNALAPGNVNGRVVPPQRVRSQRGRRDWQRMVTTMFGLEVRPDLDEIPAEPGHVINVAVVTQTLGDDLYVDIYKRSRYTGRWAHAAVRRITTRVPAGRQSYPASRYDWRSYLVGPRPGGGVAGSEYANEANEEAIRRQAEEYAVGRVDAEALAAQAAEAGGYQGRRFAPPIRPRRGTTGYQGGFQPQVQPPSDAPGQDRGPGAGNGEESAQGGEKDQGTAVVAAGMGGAALLGLGLAVALSK